MPRIPLTASPSLFRSALEKHGCTSEFRREFIISRCHSGEIALFAKPVTSCQRSIHHKPSVNRYHLLNGKRFASSVLGSILMRFKTHKWTNSFPALCIDGISLRAFAKQRFESKQHRTLNLSPDPELQLCVMLLCTVCA